MRGEAGAGVLWAVEVFSEPTAERKGGIYVYVRNNVVRRVAFGLGRRNRKDAFKRAERLAIKLAAA